MAEAYQEVQPRIPHGPGTRRLVLRADSGIQNDRGGIERKHRELESSPDRDRPARGREDDPATPGRDRSEKRSGAQVRLVPNRLCGRELRGRDLRGVLAAMPREPCRPSVAPRRRRRICTAHSKNCTTVQDDRILADRCLAALMDFADNESKRLVLIVENLNTLFDDIGDSDVGWQLRKTLQDEPRIFLIGSATSRFEEIDNSSRALYDLFQVHTLQRLNTEACATLWKNVSDQDIGMRSIRPLEILTGGNPRLLAIVALFGARQSFRELMDDMLALVDDHTEYFRSHLESLAPQERRVYLALATLWKPATAKEVSGLVRRPTSQCSALLGRLVDRGAVLRSGGTPRRQEYYLAERMYNIYYLLRKSRGTDHMVEALVRFMTSFYSPSELTDFRERISSEATDADDPTRKLIEAALRLLPSPTLPVSIASRGHLESHFQSGTEVDTSFLHTTQDSKTESGIQRDPDADASQAGDLTARVQQLLEDERYAQAIKVCDEIETRFGEVNSLKVTEHVANSAVMKAVSLGRLGRPDDAIAICNEILNRYSTYDSPGIVKTVATALANKVALLGRLALHEEVLAACEAFADRFDSSDSSATAKDRVHVLYNKGAALVKLGQPEEASAVFDGLISLFRIVRFSRCPGDCCSGATRQGRTAGGAASTGRCVRYVRRRGRSFRVWRFTKNC